MKNKYSNNYNTLQDVIVADDELSQMGRDGVLTPLLEVISKYKLQNVVGLRLLHNHNHIHTDEIMLEGEEESNHEKCLTTKATRLSEVRKKYYPNSWALDGTLIPLEYSSDTFVKYDSLIISNHSSFIQEFNNELKKLGVNHLIGLYLLNRKFFNEEVPGRGMEYRLMETTDIARRANVLRFEKSDTIDKENIIDTVWAAHTTEITMGCERVKVGCSSVPIVHCSRDGDEHNSNTSYSHAKDYEHTFKP